MRVFYRILMIIPFVYWVWALSQNEMGAEPLVKLNTQTGYVGLIFLLINLLLGFLLWLRNLKINKFVTTLYKERRALGIACGLYFLLHIMTYFAKEAFEYVAIEQLYTKTYLTMGFCAFLIIEVLALTSNDFAVRKLGIKKWKLLHRSVYLAMVLMLFHVFQIEKGNLILLAVLINPVLLLQIYRAISNLIGHFRPKTT